MSSEMDKALANLRKELWLMLGDWAFRQRWWGLAHEYYQKAIQAAKDEAK